MNYALIMVACLVAGQLVGCTPSEDSDTTTTTTTTAPAEPIGPAAPASDTLEFAVKRVPQPNQ